MRIRCKIDTVRYAVDVRGAGYISWSMEEVREMGWGVVLKLHPVFEFK